MGLFNSKGFLHLEGINDTKHLTTETEILSLPDEFADKIYVPVLFGENGTVLKHFEADAYHKEKHIVIEVEAGRAVTNYQFLKDYFEACMMQNVDFLCIAVRMKYRTSNDYEKVKTFFETLFLSQRITTELKGILIIGY